MKKGILIISPSFDPDMGGMATHLSDLCKYLVSSDYRVFVATCQPIMINKKSDYYEHSENIIIIRVPLFGWRLFIPSGRFRFIYETFLLFPAACLLLISQYRNIDVIHTHGHTSSFVSKLLKTIFSKRVILSTHNQFGFNRNKISNRIVQRALLSMDFILAVSEQSKYELIRMGVNEQKIAVYTQWVDQDTFKPMEKKTSKDKVGWLGKFIVLYVGRMESSKGVGVLLDVAKMSDQEITFAFIGAGSMADKIRTTASSRTNIIFAGEIDNKNLPLYLNASDILVIPTQLNEGFGRVIIEAFSCGLPVIGSKRGRIPDIINKDVGVIVDPPDADNIFDAIMKLNSDRDKLSCFSNNAISYARERYGSNNAETIVECYEQHGSMN